MIKGYKCFNKDLQCKKFQFEIGKKYEINGELKLCENGFHFCKDLKDCYNYYDFTSRVCEVKGTGKSIIDDDKVCFEKIEIIRELSLEEIYKLANYGLNNEGFLNKGNWNKGDSNIGDGNVGNDNE